ncbi:MAG: hypothetical protein HND44_17315 [Chloroflexi bacterium]|nr:hypothetical protein [Ardenticatenaceae bacterium]MBL1130213.1 hypothetical protein [Chloroflexota bacterium]NOG36304.1 hypothetical protein [Chloroflexota bacterium]GIK58364.1 MAG: hypothetical protein BroJett015_40270 [Chloroflexota bacterium]
MNKTEQQLADELDQMVTAVMQGKAAEEMPTHEAHLAANLIDLSAQTNPDPDFVAQLQRRLSARANQLNKSRAAPEQASFWRDLTQMLKEGFTMKRTLALGAVLTLILLFGAVALGRGFLPGGNTPQVAEVTPAPEATLPETTNTLATPEETAVAEQPTPAEELAQLPRFEAQAPGMGGGGDGTAAADAPMPIEEFDLKMMDPFSGTTFILNSTLPIEPVSGFVQLRQPEVALTPEQARAIADQYGFTGPLFVETYPADVPEDAPPPVYIIFDGPRNLRMDSWAINYTDEAAAARFNYENWNPTLRPETVAIAEAFLAQRGQLNFPYEAEAQVGDSVVFYRLVDGRRVNEPEISVSLNPENEVAYVWDNTSTEWTAVGNYPLITAEQAWQRVLGGVFENHIQFQTIMPDPGVVAPVEELPDYLADYQYWGREFTPNSEVHLYEWPVVYRPVDGSTPLVKIRGFNVIADDATLNALAGARDSQLHIWGTLNGDKTELQLAGWEALAEYTPVFQVGVVRWQGDELRFYGEDGSIYILPNAPADIAEGLKVNLFGYGVRDTGLEYPVLDWESIDKYIEYPEPELPIEGEGYPADGDVSILPIDGPFAPFRYGQVTVNHVELVFFVTYAFPEIPEGQEMTWRPSPTIYLQPAWAFTGTADNGDTIKLFVQAVADEYLQP